MNLAQLDTMVIQMMIFLDAGVNRRINIQKDFLDIIIIDLKYLNII